MPSVTQRISQVKQPRGGYLNPKDLTLIQLSDGENLAEEENVSAGLVGLVVDYMTRYMLGTDVVEAFAVSIMGAEIIGEKEKCIYLLTNIKGLDDKSLIAATKVVGYDVCFRAGPMGYRPVDTIMPDKATLSNMRTMINRSLAFFKQYGPITKDGFTFEGGYTETVQTGDGDFLTEDTLWDFKVSIKDPTNKHTLQLLMYYIMGIHSVHPFFKKIKRIGVFNPRLNRVYLYDLANVPAEVIEEIERDVICY